MNLPKVEEPKVVLSHCDECGVSYSTTIAKRFDRMCDECMRKQVVTHTATADDIAAMEFQDDLRGFQRDRDLERVRDF